MSDRLLTILLLYAIFYRYAEKSDRFKHLIRGKEKLNFENLYRLNRGCSDNVLSSGYPFYRTFSKWLQFSQF